MWHEKTLKRDSGLNIKIEVSFYADFFTKPNYSMSVFTKERNKRKWMEYGDNDSYKYRALSLENRREYRMNEYLKILSKEELLEAKMELWHKLKPEV